METENKDIFYFTKFYFVCFKLDSRHSLSGRPLLPNQTWVCLSALGKANVPTAGCGEEKYGVYCRASSKEPRAASAQNP